MKGLPVIFCSLVGIICSIYAKQINEGVILPINRNLLADGGNESGWALEEEESLFYMYELDEEFWWSWPDESSNCSKNGYVGHEHQALSGMGVPVSPDDGLFLTWHFSLFSSLWNRYKRSRRRTYDPEKASMFIVPYDLGLDGYLNPTTCETRRSCTRGRAEKLTKLLGESKWFQRHNGRDHVVLWSLGQYHPWPRGCDRFMHSFCRHCTFTCYWMDPHKVDNRFVSVPFPAAYHFHDDIRHIPWEVGPVENRNLTVVYLGSTQTLTPPHTKIRRAMVIQCEQHASRQCRWLQIEHSSKDSSISKYLTIYKSSIFCLCPPGDDPARKAVFDAIVSGCIPVIFEVATLYNQYPWHLSEEDALAISVFVPGAKVRENKVPWMDYLLNMDMALIRKKQEALARIAPTLQYSMPPVEDLRDPADATVWEPPFHDGADLALEGMFDRTAHVVRNETVGIPRLIMEGRDWNFRYGQIIAHEPGADTRYLPFSNIPYAVPGASNSVDKKAKIKHEHSHKIQRRFRKGEGQGQQNKEGSLGRPLRVAVDPSN
jgi:hypothetical protein